MIFKYGGKIMTLGFSFFFNSILLGVGLSMDAFSVSLANGLNEPDMKKPKMLFIALTFAVYQALMPLIGWICVHTAVNYFEKFNAFIPWIALILLLFIGGKMLLDGIKNKGEEEAAAKLGLTALMLQGIATSIDALSVGFTISDYSAAEAVIAALIIAAVTFVICTFGVIIGKKFGTALSNKAQIFGGCILIFIGIEIFLKGMNIF